MCVYLYIDNKYTQYTHILCKQKLLFWRFLKRLNVIYIYIYIHMYSQKDFFLKTRPITFVAEVRLADK